MYLNLKKYSEKILGNNFFIYKIILCIILFIWKYILKLELNIWNFIIL